MYDVCDRFKRAFTHGKSASHVGKELWLHPLAGHEVSKIPRSASSGKVNVDKSQDHVRHRVTIMSRSSSESNIFIWDDLWWANCGPSRVKIRAPMGSPNNFHFSIRRCGLFWLWREWTTFVSILRQLDSRSLVCFTNWIGYLFIVSFVQSQDSYRPIVSGSKSSFLAFPKLDIFDIQRFFTCAIQIQCSMHLYLSLKHEIGNEVKRPSETAMLGLW